MQPSLSSAQTTAQLKQALGRHAEGRLREALSLYQQVISNDPGNFDALHGIGILYGQWGEYEQALRFIAAAGAVRPGDFSVHYNQGKALHELERLEEALSSYDRALALRPGYVPGYNNRGNVLKDLGRHEEALASYDRALSLKPDYVDAHNNRGNILQDLRRYEDAIASYETAIRVKADCAETYYNLGNALKELDRDEEVLAAYDKAISLRPDYAEAHCNRGLVLHQLQRCDEALGCYDKAIVLNPDYAEAYYNRGNVLKDLRRYQDAVANFDRAIALRPEDIGAHFNKALVKLLLGDYETGWSLHEWRWKTEQHRDYLRNFKQDLWLGDQPVAGRRILLHAEQGLGDVIQYARYAPMVAALGATTILEVPSPLVPLLETLAGAITVIAAGSALPEFDLHCPLASLPLAFKTTVAAIPAEIPYLAADGQRRSEWRARLGSRRQRRVGLAWSGNPRHRNDRNRSISLRILEPLLRLDCEYHSLQKELRDEDQTVLAQYPNIRGHETELRDFADTAALVAELDLVITVDTSVAHLAGALGKEVWILLPYVADYRWMTERSDSPWYPSARLVRQHARGDWTGVIEDIHSRLKAGS